MAKNHIKAQANSYRLPFGIGHVLHLEIVNVSSNFKCTLIGMEHHRYLIIKIPDIVACDFEEKCLKYIGAQVTGKFVHRGTVFYFETNLMGIINNITQLLFVRYPLHVKTKSTR